MKRFVIIAVFVVALIAVLIAQKAADKSQRPSPPATALFQFGDGQSVTIDYSRPSMRGRKIFGGLVPYGKVWRTGANEATTFVATSDVTINQVKVPKGNYTLWTLPGENGWKLIINRQTGQWGTEYDPSKDLVRIDMQTLPLPAPVEKFLISFEKTANPNEVELRLDWENTRAHALIASTSAK